MPSRRTLPLAGDPARVPPERQPGPVDVVVPVYGAAAELADCLASVLAHTDLSRHRLVVVVDGPQDAGVEAALARLPVQAPGETREVALLRNPERRGFVASANRGTALSQRDVVLLNSDTRVTARWLDKLQEAAYSAPEIATVTPFSNDATICSLPRFAAANELPAGWDLDRFAALIEAASARERPRLPTGVGVCLYIKRKALDALGPLDEERFGLGYGEESELCTRALKAGFANVLDDATFIFHVGQGSFGGSRKARVRAAHRTLRRLHPEYMPTVARFLREDPVRPARERVLAELRRAELEGGRPRGEPRPASPGEGSGAPGAGPAPQGPAGRRARRLSSLGPDGPRRVLHLVHGWPPYNSAGTEVYARGLALRQAAVRQVAVYARIANPRRGEGDASELLDHGVRVRLTVKNFTQRDPLARNALHDRRLAADFDRLLADFEPDLLHVHHLAGHAAALPLRAARRGVPIVYHVQDWWAPCARVNLFHRDRYLCSGPAPGKCSRCLPLTGLPPAPLLNRALYLYRARLLRRVLAGAGALVMGSRAIADSYRALGWLRPEDPVHVVPYGVELPEGGPADGKDEEGGPARGPEPRLPLRFGYVGSIVPHKGVHVAVAAFAGIDPARARLHVWGDLGADAAYTAELRHIAGGAGGADVRFEGRFPEGREGEVFAGMDVLLIPSLGLESFGLVAREAFAHGVPVLASDRGALAELFEGAEQNAVEPTRARAGGPEGSRVGEAGARETAAGAPTGAGELTADARSFLGEPSAGVRPDPSESAAGPQPFPGESPYGARPVLGESACGALFDPSQPGELRAWIERLVTDPGRISGWRRRLPAVKGMDEHALEIEAIYEQVLAGRRRRR